VREARSLYKEKRRDFSKFIFIKVIRWPTARHVSEFLYIGRAIRRLKKRSQIIISFYYRATFFSYKTSFMLGVTLNRRTYVRLANLPLWLWYCSASASSAHVHVCMSRARAHTHARTHTFIEMIWITPTRAPANPSTFTLGRTGCTGPTGANCWFDFAKRAPDGFALTSQAPMIR